jgi:hypothetical protein
MEVMAELNCPVSIENAHIGNNIDCLDSIHRPEINLAIWKRNSLTFKVVANEILATSFSRAQFIYDRADPIDLIGAYLDEMVDVKSESALLLWTDIMNLADRVLRLCSDQEIGIGLERIRHDNCTSYHVDKLGLRLLCTYSGEATHWVGNNNVNRNYLGQNDNDNVIRNWNQIQVMAQGWVGVFKGEKYIGNEGLGIVHRSPEISKKDNAERLLLRIDTINRFKDNDDK